MSKHILEPTHLIIHCSDYGRDHTAKDVHDWHVKRGWSGNGYHDIIEFSGKVSRGRPFYWKGSHCKAKGMNHKALGVCMLGKSVFNEAQWLALEEYILQIVARYPNIVVAGHRDFDRGKTCPNFDVKDWVRSRPNLRHVRTL